jgi:hypothetical protein
MKAPLTILFATLALAGCGQPAEKPPVAPATEANLPADAPSSQPAWSASPEGVGPLTGEVAFSRDAIAALFPGSEVKAAFLSVEGAQVPIITVIGPAELVLEAEGGSDGKVGRILAQGGQVVGPRGEKLMDSFKVASFSASDCVIGADRYSGAVLCRRPGAPNLAYVYGAQGEVKGNPGDEPDAETLEQKGFLREFLWQAPLSN